MSTPNKENQSARKRAKNYTTEEEELLVELVKNRIDIIENKKSGAVIWKQKEDAWKKIEEEFGATIGTHRHWKALRDKFEFLKRKSRLDGADLKMDILRSDSGVSAAKARELSSKISSKLSNSGTDLQKNIDSDYLIEIHDENFIVYENLTDKMDRDLINNIECEEYDSDKKEDWSNWPTNLNQPKPKDILIASEKRKKSLEEEKMELILLKQQFYRDENIRAQEKHEQERERHEQELLSLKLKNEILQLELAEKSRR